MFNSLTNLLPAAFTVPAQSFSELKNLKKNQSENISEIERTTYKTTLAAKSCLKGALILSLGIFVEAAPFLAFTGWLIDLFKGRDFAAAGNIGCYVAAVALAVAGIASVSLPAILVAVGLGALAHLSGIVYQLSIDKEVERHMNEYSRFHVGTAAVFA